MKIERNTSGVTEFCLKKAEEADANDDLDAYIQARIIQRYLREARGFAALNLAYKQLLMRAPDLLQKEKIVLPMGISDDDKETAK